MRLEIRKPSGPTEDSIAIRVVVAVAVEVAILAVVTQPGAVEPLTAVASLLLAPLGYLFSYHRRGQANVILKLVLSVALLAALGQFIAEVRLATSVDQARLPLASLFLWVQVLHAFDVPRRRDLAFSMVSSLILMAEAGSLSLSTSFVVFLVPWAVLAGVWLSLSSRPRPDQVTSPISVRRVAPPVKPPRLAPARSVAMTTTAALMAAFLLFLAMPRVPGSLVKAPPFSLAGAPSPVNGFDGSVDNPGLPADPGDGVVDFASGAYPGFSDVVDLRARGQLSDELAFRVRATQAALWRAEVFDTYEGSRWTIEDDETEILPQDGDGTSYLVPPEVVRRNGAYGEGAAHLTQTFYIDTPQPNVLFAAQGASQVYFPSAGLRVDAAGSIRSPILLDQGMVYSVVSDVPVTSPSLLRRSGPVRVDRMTSYLQVPDSLPDRVRDLSQQIVAGSRTQYDGVMAIQSWIQANTRYNLDAPRDPDGVDSIDHFLFETREGFCEQIASSMAIMLRTLGVPTRLVTGYGPGSRNPLTGYFEVKQSDAHAWLEVFYPRIGWVPYDPTFGVPEAAPSVASRFMAGPVLSAIGRFLSTAVPQPVKAALGATVRGVMAAGAFALKAWPLALVIAAIAAGVVWELRRRRTVIRSEGATVGETAFLELVDALAPAGHDRDPSTTPAEYLGEVVADPELAAEVIESAELVVRTFEQERYAPAAAKPSEADVLRARAASARVRQLVSRH